MDSKRNHETRVQDRISDLPDALACLVLSFLPTVDAVRASVLVTRNNLWTCVPNISIDNKDFTQGPPPQKWLTTFINRVLSLRDSSIPIKKFRLNYGLQLGKEDLPEIDHWISTAISSGVVELDLCFHCENSDRFTYKFPESFFTCRTLVVLKVDSNFVTYAPPTSASGCFPSLKILHVRCYTSLHVQLYSRCKPSIDAIMGNCPVLEDLTITGNLYSHSLNISAPELKTLRMKFIKWHDRYRISINAPKLESLVVKESAGVMSNYFLKNPVEGKIQISLPDDRPKSINAESMTAFLAHISGVKNLSIFAPLETGYLPVGFHSLKHLELGPCCVHSFWEVMTELLIRSPNLEHLVLISGDEARSKSRKRFNPPEFVPICLLSCLKTVSIPGKQKEMMKLAKYLLLSSTVLQKMTLPIAAKQLYKRMISVSPKGSKTCKVEFI